MQPISGQATTACQILKIRPQQLHPTQASFVHFAKFKRRLQDAQGRRFAALFSDQWLQLKQAQGCRVKSSVNMAVSLTLTQRPRQARRSFQSQHLFAAAVCTVHM